MSPRPVHVRVAATTIVLAGLVTVCGATAAHATTASCAYDGTTDTMTVSMPDAAMGAKVSRSGSALTVDDTICGNAKLGNTDEIVVNGGLGRQSLEISLAAGALEPGTTVEADTSEIEITPHLGDGTDALTITGSPAGDNIRLGKLGINLNGDTDRDVTLDGVDIVQINGGASGDTLSAAGGLGTGGKFIAPVNMHGGEGNDTVTGGQGRDVLYGDAGNDTVNGDDGRDYVYGGDDDDQVGGGSGNDYLYGDAGVDSVDGGSGDDSFGEGSAVNGNDTIAGGSGSDSVSYYARTNPINVTIDGVANDGETGENDNVTTDVESVSGSQSAANTLVGSSAANTMYGGSVTDDISGGGGKDTLYGYDGADHLVGGSDNDGLYGGEGADTLEGGNDDDNLQGNNGNDTVIGGAGDDYVFEDYGPNGADDISGGSGHDKVEYSGRTGDLTVTLDNNADDGEAAEGDRVRSDIEDVTGGQGKNKLNGSAADNTLQSSYGSNGDDTINGGGGVDYIYSYGGNDTLTGGDGEDQLYGGDGADTFKLQDGGYDYADGGDGTDAVTNQDVGLDQLWQIP